MTNLFDRATRAFRARLAPNLRGLPADRGGQVAVIFSLLVPVVAVLIAGVIDASFGLNARTQLQDASDEAALAVSVATAQNPNATTAQLKIIGQNVLSANFPGSSPKITDFHVCAPIQHDCSDGGTTMANGTVKLAASAPTTCMMASLMPAFCTGGTTQTVNAAAVTNIKFGKTLQLNIVMDSSASMIVGATPTDVATITTWVGKNWNLVKPNDPLQNGDNPPCAFACHDIDAATKPSDIALGLTRANATGATTRFQVMTSAASQLVTHVQNIATGNTLNRTNTYLFNVSSFDTTLHSWGSNNMNYAAAQSAVSSVSPGLDTYINNSLFALATKLGSNGTGNSASSPLKFVILVTDGLQSDRNLDWQNCTGHPTNAGWNYPSCVGGFAAPLNTASCTTMKNKGIVVGVLETPYVPLTGQSPLHNHPYESNVRATIYPRGPGTASTVSTALSACASPGYYFQAVNSSDIATGFLTLTDQFLARSATIVQ